ncbi:MAG: preprotein translocase subunit YajC [Bacillota bacterium]
MQNLQAFLPFILLFAFMWFLIIRPQQQQQKKRQKMLSELKKGEKVVTVGGIHGTITEIKGDVLTLRIADKVEVNINRTGVGYVLGKSE